MPATTPGSRRTAEWRTRHPDRNIAMRRRIKARNRAIANEAKNKPCVDCGRQFPPVAMDLDHVQGEKVNSVAFAIKEMWSEARLRAEIQKCVVRCAVCHRIKTAQEMGWPREVWSK